MTSIKKATFNDVNLLASLSVEAFLPAHDTVLQKRILISI